MAQLECAFQIRFNNVNYVKVTAIKYRAVFNRSYLFEIEDQPIDLHPDFGLILKARKNIKNGDFYSISLTGASLDRYYDKTTERFKFNGRYLKPEYEEAETEKYNPDKLSPAQFLDSFNRLNKKKSEPMKIKLLSDKLPNDDLAAKVNLESMNGYNSMAEKFMDLYLPIYNDSIRKDADRTEFANFHELCVHFISFHSRYTGSLFNLFYPYMRLKFTKEQLKYVDTLKINKEEDLLVAAKNYDKCEEIRVVEEERIKELKDKRKEEEDLINQQKEAEDKQARKGSKETVNGNNQTTPGKFRDGSFEINEFDETDVSIESDEDDLSRDKVFTRNFVYNIQNNFPLISKSETLKKKKNKSSDIVRITLQKKLRVHSSSKQFLNELLPEDTFREQCEMSNAEDRLPPMILSIDGPSKEDDLEANDDIDQGDKEFEDLVEPNKDDIDQGDKELEDLVEPNKDDANKLIDFDDQCDNQSEDQVEDYRLNKFKAQFDDLVNEAEKTLYGEDLDGVLSEEDL